MHRIVTLTDVPDSDVDRVVADFEADGAQVQKTRQANGNWIVVASYPDDTSTSNSADGP